MFATARRTALLLALMIPLFMALSAPVHGADLLVVTEESPPYNFMAPNGEIAGLSSEIVHALFNEAGLKGNFQLYPWARSFSLARTRPNTLIFSIARSAPREHLFIWIGELLPHTGWFYRARQKTAMPTSLNQIKSCCTVCVVSKDIAEDDLKHLGFVLGKNYITTVSYEDCMRLVQTNAVPLLVDSPLSLAWEQSLHRNIRVNFEGVMAVPGSGNEPLYLAASLGTDAAVVARLKKAYETLQKSGKIEQIRRHFMESLNPSPQ